MQDTHCNRACTEIQCLAHLEMGESDTSYLLIRKGVCVTSRRKRVRWRFTRLLDFVVEGSWVVFVEADTTSCARGPVQGILVAQLVALCVSAKYRHSIRDRRVVRVCASWFSFFSVPDRRGSSCVTSSVTSRLQDFGCADYVCNIMLTQRHSGQRKSTNSS